MTKKNQDPSTEPIFIGKIIKEELRRQERSVTWLSRKINCDRRNVYDIFSRPYIDTGLLLKISMALNVNFFAVYNDYMQSIDMQQITPPHIVFRNLTLKPNPNCLMHNA